MTLVHFTSAILFAAAGACVLVVVVNRTLVDMRHNWIKMPLFGLAILSLMVLPAAFGFIMGHTWWSAAPILVLGGIAAGETHRVVLRRRCRGHEPVERHNHGVSISRPVTTTSLSVSRFEIELPGWKDAGLRIAHVSDLHVNDEMPATLYQEMWKHVEAAAPDLLFITGDFVSREKHLPLLREVLAARPRGPKTFAALGNHDYWTAPDLVENIVREAGIDVLGNRHRRLTPEGHPGIVLSGCEDPWAPARWTPPERQPGDVLLVLSHTADNVYRLNRAGAGVVFSGHYHAGQFRIPHFGSLVIPSLYGRRFDHGHFIVNGTHLFVTAGIGSNEPPLRLYCQPDLFIVDIAGQGSDE